MVRIAPPATVPQSTIMMRSAEVRGHCQSQLDEDGRALLRLAMNQLSLSARALHRVLKIARTVADLGGSDPIGAPHLAEALQYRRRTSV
jgi:magnesium chelatase family protein